MSMMLPQALAAPHLLLLPTEAAQEAAMSNLVRQWYLTVATDPLRTLSRRLAIPISNKSVDNLYLFHRILPRIPTNLIALRRSIPRSVTLHMSIIKRPYLDVRLMTRDIMPI